MENQLKFRSVSLGENTQTDEIFRVSNRNDS